MAAWTEGVTAELCDGDAEDYIPDMIMLTQCYYQRGPFVFAAYDHT